MKVHSAPLTAPSGPWSVAEWNRRNDALTAVFDGTRTHPGISGDRARVTTIDRRVLIRAFDMQAEAALAPEQALNFAEAVGGADASPDHRGLGPRKG